MIEIQIPDYVKILIDRLYENGHKAYIVGGCVRDFILGKEPYDWDVTASSLPDETAAVFHDHRLIEAGRKHGTIGIISDDKVVEITTFRTDGQYTYNRHPTDVSFTSSIHEDLSRRDFTINALAYSPYDGFVDDFNGIDDINRRIIKAIGDPDKRFREDALRILRCLRFSAKLDFEIEKETGISAINSRKLLKNISIERISSEIMQIITLCSSVELFRKYFEIFRTVLPDIPTESYFSDKFALLADIKDDLIERLSGFFILTDTEKDKAKEIMQALRLPNNTVDDVISVFDIFNIELIPDKAFIKHILKGYRLYSVYSVINLKKVIYKRESDYYENILAVIDSIISDKECYSLKELAINGNDLKQLGISGKLIGTLLNSALEAVINESVPNNKTELLKFIETEKEGGTDD